MNSVIKIGDKVRLLSVPGWLIHDLPESEVREIIACIGNVSVVTEIDSHGYFWIGFGDLIENDESAYYSGHSFAVPNECIEKI